MSTVAFKQVDVFTDRASYGNPVAVVFDAAALDAATMQRIAHWTNLSETVFVLPPTRPEASYRVRIFTPRKELPFAGRSSVGTAHAVLEAGLAQAVAGALMQECAAGLLPLRIETAAAGRLIAVRAPATRFGPVLGDDDLALVRALGVGPADGPPPQLASNGPTWWLVPLADAATVRALQPDLEKVAALSLERGADGIAAFGADASGEFDLVVRCFCPGLGMAEDAVNGSANALIAAWLQRHGRLPGARYRASQGRELGRDGRLVLEVDADGVWVGGNAVTVIEGRLLLP